MIAYEQTDDAGETKGDLVFGTRSTTSGAGAATQQVRLRSNGTVEVETNLQVDSTAVFNDEATFERAVTIKGTFTASGGYDMSADITMTKTAAGITHVAAPAVDNGLTINSTNGYVGVEDVKFTGVQIGIEGDEDIITLTSAASVGNVAVAGGISASDDVTLSKQSAALTHSGSTGGGLSITSTNGYVEISSTASYVDVESVRVTGAQMGVSGDTDIITLSSASGVGNVAIAGELNVSLDVDVGSSAFVVTASDGSLAISSNKFTVAGDTGNTVVAGTLNATGAATLSSTLDVAGDVDVNSGKFAVTASDGSLAISSNKFTVAGDTGNTVVAGTLDATGGDYVEQPELGSCGRVAGDLSSSRWLATRAATVVASTLNVTGAATLSSTLDVAGDVDVNSGKFAVTALDGSLAISSNKFTVAGDTGNTVVAGTLDATLGWTTLDVAGDVDVNSGKFATAVEHAGISTGEQVHGERRNTVSGTLNVTGAATLSSTLDVAGDVDVNSGKFAVTASDGSLAISSNKFTVAGDTGNTVVSGHLAVGGPTGDSAKEVYVTGDIEATGTLAIGGDATFAGAVTVTGLFTALGDYRIGDSAPSDSLTVNAASNYTGTTTMSNTLDVIGAATLESTLSVGGATTLSSTLGVVSDVRIGAVGARKLVVSGSDGSLAIQTNKFTVAGNTGNTVVAGTLDAGGTTLSSLSSGAATLSSTLDVTGATTLSSTLNVTGAATLSSTLDVAGDVDVNSGKFAVTASDGSLAISSNKFTVAGDTGNTVVAGTLDAGGTTLSSLSSGAATLSSTLDVTGATTLSSTLNVTGAATLSSTLDVAGDVDVNSGKFAVTASDGSLAISSNKFTVAGNTGNTVVAGTLDAGGTTLSSLSSGAATLSSTLDVTGATTLSSTLNVTGAATLSSTLDVAGDVDVNSGKFAVTASDGSLAISSNKFTVAGNTGNTVVAGTLDAGGTTLSAELGSCDAVEHAGCDGSDDAVEHVERDGARCRARWMWQATWT